MGENFECKSWCPTWTTTRTTTTTTTARGGHMTQAALTCALLQDECRTIGRKKPSACWDYRLREADTLTGLLIFPGVWGLSRQCLTTTRVRALRTLCEHTDQATPEAPGVSGT